MNFPLVKKTDFGLWFRASGQASLRIRTGSVRSADDESASGFQLGFQLPPGRVRMAGKKKKNRFLVSALHRDVKWDGSSKVRQGEPEMRTVISVASVLAS